MKPIIFNTEMVRAIIDGRKTQTRRVVKPQPFDIAGICNHEEGFSHIGGSLYSCGGCDERIEPKYQTDETLWVRETWCYHAEAKEPWYGYRADGDYRDLDYRWRPSIHMPREAARIFLKVTGVRVERVREISEADAVAEGVDYYIDDGVRYYGAYPNGFASPDGEYRELWDSIYAQKGYGWDTNPWVWVYEFERVEGGAK